MSDVEKNNSLTLFRYIAAIQVILGHLTLLNVSFPSWLTIPFSLFQGVPVFFGISGFLIWKSLNRETDVKVYAKKRFLRLYPELWMGVAISIITIIAFYKEKIEWLLLGVFTFTQATFLQFWTPEFLRGYGSGTPNGSLWTICIFVQFYIVAYFMFWFLKNKNVLTWIICIAVAIVFDITYPLMGGVLKEVVFKLYGQTLLPYLYLFLVGMFLAKQCEKAIPILKKIW